MPEAPTDDTLPIRCPGCGQRFKVGPELMGRMVECGTCENRFRVNDDVIARNKRHYPGDRKDQQLERFSRVPMASSVGPGFQPAHYSPEPVQRAMGPTSPLRLLCGFMAAIAVVVAAYLMVFASHPGGLLDGVDQTKRVMLSSFAAVIASALIMVANPKARGKAALSSLAVIALLVSLPFFVKPVAAIKGRNGLAGQGGKDDLDSLLNLDNGKPAADPDEDPLADLKKEVGYAPLEKEILRGNNTPGKAPAGLWLRDLKEYHKPQVANYIIRSTGADVTSHMYPRPPDYLMVVTGVTDDLSELAKFCERFGEVKRIIPELRVIEVGMRNDTFQEGPFEKLTNVENPDFYDLNRRELESIDLERCRNAILRLSHVEPKSYRPDIVRRMQQLLKEGDREMQGQIAQALEVWAQPDDGSVEAVRKAAQLIHSEKVEMPETIIAFLASRKDAASIPMLDDLWASDASKWETAYSGMGPAVEPFLTKRMADTTPVLKMSAVRILGRSGTAKSIPAMEALRQNATGELRSLIDTNIAQIRSRGN